MERRIALLKTRGESAQDKTVCGVHPDEFAAVDGDWGQRRLPRDRDSSSHQGPDNGNAATPVRPLILGFSLTACASAATPAEAAALPKLI